MHFSKSANQQILLQHRFQSIEAHLQLNFHSPPQQIFGFDRIAILLSFQAINLFQQIITMLNQKLKFQRVQGTQLENNYKIGARGAGWLSLGDTGGRMPKIYMELGKIKAVIIQLMKISQGSNSKNMNHPEQSFRGPRKFTMGDIPSLTQKIFSQFDKDKNNRFNKDQFTTVIKALIDLVGGEIPHLDDVEDIFNLLDVNGDETIDRHEFQSIMTTFFKLLNERQIDISIEKQSDIIL